MQFLVRDDGGLDKYGSRGGCEWDGYSRYLGIEVIEFVGGLYSRYGEREVLKKMFRFLVFILLQVVIDEDQVWGERLGIMFQVY